MCSFGSFFFSSRRRHTRSKRDWSSDVCSSDLGKSSEGKGEAKHHVESAMRLVDPAWCKRFIHSNASSGEGLIRMLEDTRVKLNLTKEVRKNRFVIFNSEMVTTFNAAARKDSSLSGYLRQA